MRPLGRSNLISCRAAPTDHMVILAWGVYTISVDFCLLHGDPCVGDLVTSKVIET